MMSFISHGALWGRCDAFTVSGIRQLKAPPHGLVEVLRKSGHMVNFDVVELNDIIKSRSLSAAGTGRVRPLLT